MNLLALIGISTALAFAACAGEEAAPLNRDLLDQEPNVWKLLHTQKAGEGVTFMRQAHGGSCFDTRRGLLVLFGSNTHGKDWTNSPLYFDPVACAWSRVYPDDPRETYTVTEEGLPVCGPEGSHPWASHTFGAVMYDDARDEIVVACFDDHMQPGRFTDAVKDLWPKIKLKPTWLYRPETKTWSHIAKGASFFPHSACFDSDRKVVVGYRADGFHELSGEPRAWTKAAPAVAALTGWHTNCAYDAKHKAVVVFGHNKNAHDIGVYWPEKKEAKRMPTPGPRPPKDQHNPMEFHPKLGKTVVLVDRTRKKDEAERDTTETWLYDLGADAWTRIEAATLPFACGMNYNMEYDPRHEAMLLVTGGYGPPTQVWALKLKE